MTENLTGDVAAYIGGDDKAGNRLCAALEPVVRREAGRFLKPTDPDIDDVVQETLVAWLAYLRRAGTGPDRPEAFVTTMAANRCRNLYAWRRRRPNVGLDQIRDRADESGDDPLAALEREDLMRQLQAAFRKLDAPCRNLLRSIYLEEQSMESLQRAAGLTTVQGVFYRKYACLRKLAKLLNRSVFDGRRSG